MCKISNFHSFVNKPKNCFCEVTIVNYDNYNNFLFLYLFFIDVFLLLFFQKTIVCLCKVHFYIMNIIISNFTFLFVRNTRCVCVCVCV